MGFSKATASRALQAWMKGPRYVASSWEPTADGGARTYDAHGKLVLVVTPLMLQMAARRVGR